jgi:hypothetical protein
VRLSFADTGFAALDALEGVDAGCLFVCEDERPLKGMAGCIDWRLCGMLSRLLQEGRFIGSLGDALLFAGFGRLRPERLFCFGGGRQGMLQRDSFAKLVRKACEALSLAGAQAFVTELPPVAQLDETERARVFLQEGATRFRGRAIVLLGDGWSLSKAFCQVGERMQGLELDREPLGATTVVVAPPRISAASALKARRGR